MGVVSTYHAHSAANLETFICGFENSAEKKRFTLVAPHKSAMIALVAIVDLSQKKN